jgi:transposase
VAGRPATEYWPWQSAYGLFRRWQRDGIWKALVAALQSLADAAGHVTWDVSAGSAIARAYQHATGARGAGAVQKESPGGTGASGPAGHALAGPAAG